MDNEMPVHVGFTGTRSGMTGQQKDKVRYFLDIFFSAMFARHGDCVGADTQFHQLARSRGLGVTIHPPSDPKLRAYNDGCVLPPKPYLERNKDIVEWSDVVLATPGERDEVLRSGTWSTIRYAKKLGKPVIIVYPDGDHEEL